MFIDVRSSPLHGQGSFATRDFKAGETVARVRLLVFAPEETVRLMETNLKNYLFYVRDGADPKGPDFTGLAMGPVSFCNHSSDANCDFKLDADEGEISLVARRAIAANEEITIDYGDYAEKIV